MSRVDLRDEALFSGTRYIRCKSQALTTSTQHQILSVEKEQSSDCQHHDSSRDDISGCQCHSAPLPGPMQSGIKAVPNDCSAYPANIRRRFPELDVPLHEADLNDEEEAHLYLERMSSLVITSDNINFPIPVRRRPIRHLTADICWDQISCVVLSFHLNTELSVRNIEWPRRVNNTSSPTESQARTIAKSIAPFSSSQRSRRPSKHRRLWR